MAGPVVSGVIPSRRPARPPGVVTAASTSPLTDRTGILRPCSGMTSPQVTMHPTPRRLNPRRLNPRRPNPRCPNPRCANLAHLHLTLPNSAHLKRVWPILRGGAVANRSFRVPAGSARADHRRGMGLPHPSAPFHLPRCALPCPRPPLAAYRLFRPPGPGRRLYLQLFTATKQVAPRWC